MANLEYLRGLGQGYMEEIDQLRQRIAKLERALGGLQVAIELEAEREAEHPPLSDRAPSSASRPDGESFKEIIISEAVRRQGEFTSPELYDDLRIKYPDRDV